MTIYRITPPGAPEKFENRPLAPTILFQPFQPPAEGVLCFWPFCINGIGRRPPPPCCPDSPSRFVLGWKKLQGQKLAPRPTRQHPRSLHANPPPQHSGKQQARSLGQILPLAPAPALPPRHPRASGRFRRNGIPSPPAPHHSMELAACLNLGLPNLRERPSRRSPRRLRNLQPPRRIPEQLPALPPHQVATKQNLGAAKAQVTRPDHPPLLPQLPLPQPRKNHRRHNQHMRQRTHHPAQHRRGQRTHELRPRPRRPQQRQQPRHHRRHRHHLRP